MTIKAAASAIIDDLVESGSFFRTQVSACDYGVIVKSRAGCAVILQPNISNFELIGYGGVTRDIWGITAECYIRDPGNIPTFLTRVWDMHDAIRGAVDSGSNGNTPSRLVRVVSMNRPRNTFFVAGGFDYIPVFVEIRVQDDPA